MGSKTALHRPESRVVCDLLRRWRAAAGLTQRQMGQRLGKPHTWIYKCEAGERRIDPVELLAWWKAAEVSTLDGIQTLERALSSGWLARIRRPKR